MAIINQKLKEKYHYFNGSSSVKIKINVKKGTFTFGKAKINDNATADDIKAMYEKASSFALQQLNTPKTSTT